MKAFLRSALVQLSGFGLFVWGASEHPGYTILVSLWVLWVFTLKQTKPELPPRVIVSPEPPVTTSAPAYNEFGNPESDAPATGPLSGELLSLVRTDLSQGSAANPPPQDTSSSSSTPSR